LAVALVAVEPLVEGFVAVEPLVEGLVAMPN
jgi:hypothetical protein